MFEAVTVPSLMMMTSIVSEELLVRDTHRHRSKLNFKIKEEKKEVYIMDI